MAKLTASEIAALDCDLTDREWRQAVLTLLSAGTVAPYTTPHTSANVAVATTSTTVLAAYATRVGGSVKNISDTTVVVKLGSPATLGEPTSVAAGATYIIPAGYTGIVTAIHGGVGTKTVEAVDY